MGQKIPKAKFEEKSMNNEEKPRGLCIASSQERERSKNKTLIQKIKEALLNHNLQRTLGNTQKNSFKQVKYSRQEQITKKRFQPHSFDFDTEQNSKLFQKINARLSSKDFSLNQIDSGHFKKTKNFSFFNSIGISSDCLSENKENFQVNIEKKESETKKIKNFCRTNAFLKKKMKENHENIEKKKLNNSQNREKKSFSFETPLIMSPKSKRHLFSTYERNVVSSFHDYLEKNKQKKRKSNIFTLPSKATNHFIDVKLIELNVLYLF